MLNIRRRIAEAVATAFNAQNPVGTPVLYIDDYGDQVWTTTRSEAWVVGGDDEATPVVKLQIGRGGYDLTRVIVHRGTQPAQIAAEDRRADTAGKEGATDDTL